MNINFQSAQDKINETIDRLGTDVQYLQRIVSGSSAFDTGSLITYGYGDITEYFITGSLRCIVYNIKPEEVLIEPGFFIADYMKLQIRSNSTIAHLDRVIIPSGSGIIYRVEPINTWYGGSIVTSKDAYIRRILPRSGSTY